jgi:hypothetical protein
MVYYLAFGVVIIPFAFLMDVFVLNTEELVHGWRVYDYIAYQKQACITHYSINNHHTVQSYYLLLLLLFRV